MYAPTVCAVKNTYQILIPVTAPVILWVRIGRRTYYDESNGILRSDTDLHRITVPMKVLDTAGEYTVCWKEVVKRSPYFPKIGEEQGATFAFRPVRNDPVRAYMIADAHGMFEPPVEAAKKFEERYGKIDFLILNGDILDHSGDAANFMLYYKIADAITGGEIPVVISRGNHDLRGKCAEKLADYMPNENGNSFYSFRLGTIWGILLDCGEDKNDDHPEYGGTICCHGFRKRETAYLKQMIRRERTEYRAKGVEHRIVISHVPFTRIENPPFDIEQKTYGEWVKLLNEHVQPEVLLSGHLHRMFVTEPGEERDAYGMKFSTVVGSEVRPNESHFSGCGILWEKDCTTVMLNGQEHLIEKTN